VIEGSVVSNGTLRRNEDGWEWRSKNGVARLGLVKVIDRDGKELPARMDVTSERTRIAIEAESLASAAYPVTVDP
jgi:hypothetical protein